MDEQHIMRQAARDPRAFAPLYEAYAARVYNFCLRRLDNAQEAEDCASDVFVRALRSLPTYQGGTFAAWLFQIAHYTLIDHLRRSRPAAPLEDEFSLPDSNGQTDYEAAELRMQIAQVLNDLSEEEGTILALYLDAELTSAEIGAVVGKSAGAVRVTLHRLFKRLREKLATEVEG